MQLRTKKLGGYALPRTLYLLGALSLGVSIAVIALIALRQTAPRLSRLPAEIRGESIDPTAGTNPPLAPTPNLLPSGGAGTQTKPASKKRPKPASFQHRMVEYLASQVGKTNTDDAQSFGGSRAKVIFTPAQLAALTEPSLPPGCEKLGFETLAAFPFKVTPEMADGSNDLAVASAATREKIPAAIQALDNHFVAIRGFLLPLKMNDGLAIEFLLLRNQNMCCFGSVPKVNEWIAVEPAGQGVKPVMDQPITIMGRLRVGEVRENGYLVGIYRMAAATVIQ